MQTSHRASSTEDLVKSLRTEGGWKVVHQQTGKVIAKASGVTYWFDQTRGGWVRRQLTTDWR